MQKSTATTIAVLYSVLFLCGGCSYGSSVDVENSTASLVAEVSGETAPSPVAGKAYEHALQRSRFEVGADAVSSGDSRFERTLGTRGVFFRDRNTGATRAVRTATAELPKPLTEDGDKHNESVRAYLSAAGIPPEEVSGTHVTATMGGSGPVSMGVSAKSSHLLWYTSHLERSLGGIPVESSVAFAALDATGGVISEAVYWPPVPVEVVRRAQELKELLADSVRRQAYLAKVQQVVPGAGQLEGEIRIVHTNAMHDGPFEARAVYTTLHRPNTGGKFAVSRFDESGLRVTLADESIALADSPRDVPVSVPATPTTSVRDRPLR